MVELKNKIDFVYIFDVQDGNPNGDPDAGNLPRVDAETGIGLVTDVCLKRKVRNYIQVAKNLVDGFDIYVKEKAVLGREHVAAFNALGYSLGERVIQNIEENIFNELSDLSLPDGISLESDNDNFSFTLEADIVKDDVKKWLKDVTISSEARKLMNEALKSSKPRKASPEEQDGGRKWMCKHFYDIRTFGAVLSLKSAPNCGQVRGPIQLTFARSVAPIATAEHSITRMAVATEKEAKKQNGDNRTMGRKATVPYGLYVCHGFVSANLAKQTGFSEEDLQLFFEALKNMFDVDRSAARGLMSAQKLIVFKHDSVLGNAPANKLFDLVKTQKKPNVVVPRSFGDYDVKVPTQEELDKIYPGVTVEELI